MPSSLPAKTQPTVVKNSRREISVEQKRVVDSTARFLQVQAVAGSGKTTTLLHCVERVIKGGVAAPEILVISFSTSTQKELRLRLHQDVRVETTHALAREFASSPSAVLRPKEQLRLVKAAAIEVRKHRKTAGQPAIQLLAQLIGSKSLRRTAVQFFDLVRASGRTGYEISNDATLPFAAFASCVPLLKDVFRAYQQCKGAEELADFADMISNGRKAIEGGSAVRYSHLFVDEYQDCSPAQVRFVAALASRMKKVRVFGDKFQAIYGFAGSKFMALDALLGDVETLSLSTSFRLTRQNAALASAIASQGQAEGVSIQSDDPTGAAPQLIKCKHAREQEAAVYEIVRDLLDAGAIAESIVILAHTKAQLRILEQALLARGIETHAIYRERGTEHIRGVLRLMKKADSLRRLTKKDMTARLTRLLTKLGARVSIDTVSRHRKRIAQVLLSSSVEGLFVACAQAYMSMLKLRQSPAGKDSIAEINRWQAAASAVKSVAELRTRVKKLSAAPKVFTNTVHQAKGGEWDHVVVLNVVDGSFPFFRAGESETAIGEGRNLLYVAVTRTKKRLYLIEAPYVSSTARRTFGKRSRFLTAPNTRKLLEGRRYKKKTAVTGMNERR